MTLANWWMINIHIGLVQKELVNVPGGHSHWKGVWGRAMVMTPFFFQTSQRSLAYQFTVNAPLLCPLFSIFRKFLHPQPCFGHNSSSLDPNFSFLRPLYFKENPLPRPYILKPAWHTSTKKKLSAPPPPPPRETYLAVLGIIRKLGLHCNLKFSLIYRSRFQQRDSQTWICFSDWGFCIWNTREFWKKYDIIFARVLYMYPQNHLESCW